MEKCIKAHLFPQYLHCISKDEPNTWKISRERLHLTKFIQVIHGKKQTFIITSVNNIAKCITRYNGRDHALKTTVSSIWDWSGLPYLVQLLTWLHVSEYCNVGNTERG